MRDVRQVGSRPAAGHRHVFPRGCRPGGVLADREVLRLCRLRYAGSAREWGFAIYRASHDDYEDSFLLTGFMGGSPEDALDTACGLYLADPAAST
jgi:hypothetical protein